MEINISKFLQIKDMRELVSSFSNIKSACFSGNRPSKLPWGYNESCELCNNFKKKLKNLFLALIDKGVTNFISGMAMGFDMICAEIVLNLKEEGKNVTLECAIPCLDQDRVWQKEYKERYKKILSKADKLNYITEMGYFNGCYHIRNHYMVEHSDIIIACLMSQSGGTKSTVDYALKQGKEMFVVSNL